MHSQPLKAWKRALMPQKEGFDKPEVPGAHILSS